jgi:ABC-2 type transport system ATP-binding protein
LSGGQKQRLALAGAVIHRPDLLLLDEPTSAVDPESRRDFWEKLFDLADIGTTILVSTHYMDEAERCHRLAILDHGHLVADGVPAELAAALDGRVLKIACTQTRQAQALLLATAGVQSVAQIGSELRVMTNPNPALREHLIQLLAAAGIVATVEPARPNLEDVFVAATHPPAAEHAA